MRVCDCSANYGKDCMFPEELESLINQHRATKKSFGEGYSFSTKHGEIKREADSAAKSWESKRKRAANKIKRLLKEIEILEGEEVSYGKQRDVYQKRLDLAVNYEEYIKSVIANE